MDLDPGYCFSDATNSVPARVVGVDLGGIPRLPVTGGSASSLVGYARGIRRRDSPIRLALVTVAVCDLCIDKRGSDVGLCAFNHAQ